MSVVKTVPYDANGHVVKEYFESTDPRFNNKFTQRTTHWLPNIIKTLDLTFTNVSGGSIFY
jgi:hypothetical protein